MNKRIEAEDKLDEFYNFEIPSYVKSAGKTYITINFGHDWNDDIRPRKIKIIDVVKYYATQACSLSGCRTLAGFTSDWRYIDNLAKECLEWFKFVNIETLRKEGKKLGLEAKF